MLARVFLCAPKRVVGTADSNRASESLSQELIEFYKVMLGERGATVRMVRLSRKPTPLQITLSPQAREKWKGARLLYPHQLSSCVEANTKNHQSANTQVW
jgi:hypothetical protein